MTVRPLTVALPCAGRLVIVILVAAPVIVGAIVLFVLFALTVTELEFTVGAGGRTVTVCVTVLDVPPGPFALIENVSFPE